MQYDNKNVQLARNLRKNMTPWEIKLWCLFLRKYPLRFTRQKPIGRFIADFYCAKAKLVVELDGSGHNSGKQKEKDAVRTDFFESLGITVIRFSNLDIDKNFYGVCSVIDEMIKTIIPQDIKSSK